MVPGTVVDFPEIPLRGTSHRDIRAGDGLRRHRVPDGCVGAQADVIVRPVHRRLQRDGRQTDRFDRRGEDAHVAPQRHRPVRVVDHAGRRCHPGAQASRREPAVVRRSVEPEPRCVKWDDNVNSAITLATDTPVGRPVNQHGEALRRQVLGTHQTVARARVQAQTVAGVERRRTGRRQALTPNRHRKLPRHQRRRRLQTGVQPRDLGRSGNGEHGRSTSRGLARRRHTDQREVVGAARRGGEGELSRSDDLDTEGPVGHISEPVGTCRSRHRRRHRRARRVHQTNRHSTPYRLGRISHLIPVGVGPGQTRDATAQPRSRGRHRRTRAASMPAASSALQPRAHVVVEA